MEFGRDLRQSSGNSISGRKIVWKAGPGTITSELRPIEPDKAISWTGSTFGIRAIHLWKIEEANGLTKVTTEEPWDGLVARLFKDLCQKMLKQAVNRGLELIRRRNGDMTRYFLGLPSGLTVCCKPYF